MKKIINAFFLTIIALVTFSCSDVPSPYDINEGGNGEGPALIGDGTKENPFDVASAMKKQDNSEAWVMGYIVGCVNDKSIQADAVFEPPFTNAANILIAATATEKNYKNCIPVQLVSGSDVRTALNLKDNGANLGKAVVIQGKLVAYFGVPGLKEPTAAVLDGKDVGGGGTDPGPGDKDNPFGLDASNPVNSFSADFEDVVANADYTLAGWTNAAAQGNRKWQGKTFTNTTSGGTDKYIQATAQGATVGLTYESWFITPAFTVNNIEGNKIVFDCAGAFFAASTTLKVYFLELVAGKMTQTAINVAGIPTSGDNVWVPGLSIDLTPFAGKVGFVGFQYIGLGGMGTSASYRLDNIKAGEGSGGGDPDPEPTTGELIISEYVEGGGNNKYLEIYNPTGQTVDLSSYVLKLELNGGGAWTKEMALTGSLASHAVIVYKNSKAAAYTGEAIINDDVINFNGNDPIGLFKAGVLIDLFGVPGAGTGDFAKDETFRRKSTVKAPSATYNASEWEVLAKDDVTGLGAHTMD